MRLTPAERDRLLLFTAAQLARARHGRGLRLNVPESVALIADTVCEAARDGARLAEAALAGASVLTPDDVLPGVVDVVRDVTVEATFDDGTRLVVVRDPFGDAPGMGSDAPGAVITARRDRVEAADIVRLEVVNTGAVPVTITSHFHFFEVNRALDFDRRAAYGRRLAVPAGEGVRFEPATPRRVALTPIGGDRVAVGFAGLVDGPLDAPGAFERACRLAAEAGYRGVEA